MDLAVGVRYMYRMPLSIRLPPGLEARLASLAARTGRSKTFYVTEAIGEHLADLEDTYLAERELARVRAGRSPVISLDDLMAEYGLEG